MAKYPTVLNVIFRHLSTEWTANIQYFFTQHDFSSKYFRLYEKFNIEPVSRIEK
jgi:hypothetical protein